MVATMRCRAHGRPRPGRLSLATDVAEWLVKQGVPFRDAHEISGRSCARARSAESDSRMPMMLCSRRCRRT
jgi:argininosuccinate lyase